MRRFHFRLERVLQWKQQRQRQAEIRQQQAQWVLAAAKTATEQLSARLVQAAQALEAQIGQPIPVASWLARQDHGAQIRRALETAEADVQLANQKLQEAEALRTQIATEVEALLVLRQRQWQAYQEEAVHTEQNRLDELGLRRWQKAQGDDAFGARARNEGQHP